MSIQEMERTQRCMAWWEQLGAKPGSRCQEPSELFLGLSPLHQNSPSTEAGLHVLPPPHLNVSLHESTLLLTPFLPLPWVALEHIHFSLQPLLRSLVCTVSCSLRWTILFAVAQMHGFELRLCQELAKRPPKSPCCLCGPPLSQLSHPGNGLPGRICL